MAPRGTRFTNSFDAIAKHLEKECRIPYGLSSKRLHKIKEMHGLPGDYDTQFDFSGGVYSTDCSEFFGQLTTGGAKEAF